MEHTVSSGVDVPVTLEDDCLTVGECVAAPGDAVRWHVGEHTVSIWFPAAGVFAAPALAAHKSGDIVVAVPRNARTGRYHYVIYCHDADMFGSKDDLPVMEIREP